MASPTPSDLWQLARTPRFLLRAGLALLLILAFILLGRWQWERTQDVLASERAALAEVAAVDSLNPIGQGMTGDLIGRAVTADGQYEPADQRVVLHRGLNGRAGVWMVTPLRLADGSLIAVMRGWLPSAYAAGSQAPLGPVSISGVLRADESFYRDAQSEHGTVVSISRQSLGWGERARSGYIVLASQRPVLSPAPIPVPAAAQSGDVAFPFQNFFYAFQWWIFGLFVMAVYLRWLWLDAEVIAESAAGPPAGSGEHADG